MNDYDKTTRLTDGSICKKSVENLTLTIFDGNSNPRTIRLEDFQQNEVYFGRSNTNDIVLNSQLVSREHGRFCLKKGQWVIEDKGVYADYSSENGLIYNNNAILSRTLCDGDFIRIDDGVETIENGVLFVFASQESDSIWETFEIEGKEKIKIGRDENCDVVLSHITVSKVHAIIYKEQGNYYITDSGSTNGVIVNNQCVIGKVRLHEKDVIIISNSKLIFTSSGISYCCYRSGISVDTCDVTITRGKGKKSFVTGNNVNINISPGELVAIIGGSGAGKSTILNCMCGYLPPTSGEVYINGVNLYENFDLLKQIIGYVPQSDIVYDNLTLYDMLSYTAKLRLPKDVSEEERKIAINRAIRLVELTEKSNEFIKRLSGGQRKRASIAVELLSDPNLLFLDEPASGLDPGTERSLMLSLKKMASGGKTVVLVTHSTLQLKLCDKIVFMGKGGNLCFCGSYDEALDFFEVDDIVDVYSMITENAEKWRSRYEKNVEKLRSKKLSVSRVNLRKEKKKFQLPVLCSRYFKLVLNDKQRLILLLLQAPILTLLISLVADGEQFDQYEMTKSLLFALSCSAFWVGMLNAIQEVCKEKSIMKREYMTGLSLNSYVISKIVVLGILCFIQSILIIGIFTITVGLPEKGLVTLPLIEFFVTTFLTAVASTAMGLCVSSLFSNPDRAMTVAPILLMPQILFSGLIFKLEGATEMISWLALCRWSMEGYGTTADLNQLPLKLQQEGVMIPHVTEEFFEFTNEHIARAWLILVFFALFFLILARVVLTTIGKEKS